jgi:chemotaxis protein MotA
MKCGLLGAKLGHSFSPLIHQQLYKMLGMDATYELIEVPAENLLDKVTELRRAYTGLNVTIPHKVAVMAALDVVVPAAKAIGAVNTIHIKNGIATGYNTDYIGFSRLLNHNKLKVDGKKIAVLGTGGAARAVLQCLEDKYTKARYMELLAMLYEILQKARKEGLMAIEKDVEAPHESEIFKKYPVVGNDHHVIEFTTDYLRMMVSGNLNSHEIEALMDAEIDTHHAEAHAPVAAIARLAGALPAFGIVAAVLGVVNTMGSVGQPPSVLGGMIASALVGTFLGILLAYGFVEPLGGLLEQKTEDAAKEFQCIKSTLLASMQGYNPATAIEFGRKVLFSTDRPTFSELEGHVKGKK